MTTSCRALHLVQVSVALALVPREGMAETYGLVPETVRAVLSPVAAQSSQATNWPPFGVVPGSMTVFGTQPEMRFGTSLAVIRNAKRDGRTVIAVGMPRCEYGIPKPTDAGAVAFFVWDSGGSALTPLGMLESPGPFAVFGQSLANVGDINGDGLGDLLIGAPNYRAPHPYEGAWILNSNTEPWSSRESQIVVPAGIRGSRLGLSVAGAGDVNGDGHLDIIVGAPRQRGVNMRRGTVYVHHGTTNGVNLVPAWTVHGESSEDLFGRTVECAGDVNGDGYADVLVGAPRFSGNREDVGRVYLYLGSSQGLQRTPAWTADGPSPLSFMGDALASLGDINGDGFGDVALGAPGPDQNASSWPGAALIYLGSTNGLAAMPAAVLRGTFPGSLFGAALAARGDVNGDRFPDLLIGAPKFSETHPSAGRVYLFPGQSGGISPHVSWVLDGAQSGDVCGSALVIVPDVNRDGCDEILVGSIRSTTVQRREGRVDLLLGSPTNYLSTNLVASPSLAGHHPSGVAVQSPRVPPLVWYGAGGGFALVLIIGATFWRRRQHLTARAVETERHRIARDLHDDLGARLARISLLTELVNRDAAQSEEGRRNAEVLGETTREVLGAMEQILWSVNPTNDTLENLVTFIVQYTEPFFAPTGIKCRHETPPELPARIIQPAVRKNVFLAVKEALNNIAKHSSAREANVSIAFADPLLTIVIEDNGCGCAPNDHRHPMGDRPANSPRPRRGHGLGNMRARMDEIRGQFVIETRGEGGTRVRLAVTL